MAYPSSFQILIVDDDPMVEKLLRSIVSKLGGVPTSCGTVAAALESLADKDFDLVILDSRLPDGSGAFIFSEIRRTGRIPTTILLTGFPELEEAVKLTQHGLFHYLKKPFRPQEFADLLQQALHHHKFRSTDPKMPDLCGCSPIIQLLRTQISNASKNLAANVLITGETGVGKELVAQLIHTQTVYPTPQALLVSVDCSALPHDLMEAELFGCEKGAYTGAYQSRGGLIEAANGGTVFLDEIGELPLLLQTKLLRFLETREHRRLGGARVSYFGGRIIAATNRDLLKEVAAGTFRQDLYYRLDVLSLKIPPLRQRQTDIPEIAHQLLVRLAKKYDRVPPYLRNEDVEVLRGYEFPGNIRELRNLMERSLLQTSLSAKWLDMTGVLSNLKPRHSPLVLPSSLLKRSEYDLLKITMQEEKAVISRVARQLGLSRQAVLRRLEKWPELKEISSVGA
jgi:DNA-binding NtrC family response regulator